MIVDANLVVLCSVLIAVVMLLIFGVLASIAVWMAGKWSRESNRIYSEMFYRGIDLERKQLQQEIRMLAEDAIRREARLIDAIVELSRGQVRRIEPVFSFNQQAAPAESISNPGYMSPFAGDYAVGEAPKPVAPSSSQEAPGLKLHAPEYHEQLTAFGDGPVKQGAMNGHPVPT